MTGTVTKCESHEFFGREIGPVWRVDWEAHGEKWFDLFGSEDHADLYANTPELLEWLTERRLIHRRAATAVLSALESFV